MTQPNPYQPPAEEATQSRKLEWIGSLIFVVVMAVAVWLLFVGDVRSISPQRGAEIISIEE